MGSLLRHSKVYLMEAAGLFGFVTAAGILTILLEHPDLPVMQSFLHDYPLLRRLPLGLILGAYISGVILMFGQKSGAHINPTVTWTFYRLGTIKLAHAIYYTIAQFAGGIAGSLLVRATLGKWFGHPLINYGVTEPKPPYGHAAAFTAEAVISFVLMGVTLFVMTSQRLEKSAALITGIVIGIYLVFEIPFSGMSLNPARSFASALVADEWEYLWLYFVAPPAAMLLAAELFLQWKGRLQQMRKVHADWKDIPVFPIEKRAQDQPASA